MKKLVLLAFLASVLTAHASAAGFVSIGTNYNLPNYYHSSGSWQAAASCNTFYPNNSISSYCYDAYGSKVEYYPRCAYFNSYYALGEPRLPFPYPYIASPRDLGYSPVVKRYASGSRANAYYANTVQVHLNDMGSTTYPSPLFERNSLGLANSYSNYREQQYYLSTNAQTIPSEKVDASQLTYAYSGERWLTNPNYWYNRPGAGTAEPATSSTFPPAVFIGFYYSNDRQQYYDQFQVNEPLNALEGKKAPAVANQYN